MIKISFRKKGVSPLIATVLLIAFSVALGAVVMSWGRSFIDSQTSDVDSGTSQQMTCSLDVGINFVTINSRELICYDSTTGELDMTIENTGVTNISGIMIKAIDNNNEVHSASNSTAMGVGSGQRYVVSFSSIPSSLQLVTVSPIMQGQGSTHSRMCTNVNLKKDNIESC
ncbi:hypothetical protein GF327_03140 [Candidatus Woesearchaeota archaeon]|nr:hypothetical protein [Candidatus Woesearchaeota archaeon]